MLISFSIDYATRFGQGLYICGSLPELGGCDMEKALPLEYHEDRMWRKSINIDLKADEVHPFSYKYFVKNADGHIISEAGFERELLLSSNTESLRIDDKWHGRDADSVFLTKPFVGFFFPDRHKAAIRTGMYRREIIIRTTIPAVKEGEHIRLCGESPMTGAWNPADAMEMSPVCDSGWEVHLPQDKTGKKLEFKFIKINPESGSLIWEEGGNRVLEIPELQDGETYLADVPKGKFPQIRPRFFGTAIPVFSLRTEHSCGIGEFTDLRLFGDWAKKTGQSIIQLLPINDTTATGTWRDSYPYSVISVMALNPIYLNIETIGPISDAGERNKYKQEKQRLNSLNAVDYEAVLKLKREYSDIQYRDYAEKSFAEREYSEFYGNNRSWLLPYCAFCCLRDKYGTADFSKWGEYATFSPEIADGFLKPDSTMREAMGKMLFIQYHLHRQLSESVAYLHSLGIALKGDIPIGVSPHSVETWAEPQLFNSGCQAGAPPDDFSESGQNWGFPTYNWDRMALDRYGWWRKRLRKMEEYFDAYRIDHILGFFRIWEIPRGQAKSTMGHFSPALPMSPGEMLGLGFQFDPKRHTVPSGPAADDVLFIEDEKEKGRFHPRIAARSTHSYKALSREEQKAFDVVYEHFFYHRHNELWKASAYRKLPEILAATDMLACAEDLGMIPDCVPEVMDALHILSLEIFRMPKTFGVELQDPKNYPYLSVSTTGTHDMETLREWWETSHGQPCEPQTCRAIIEAHTCGNSMLTILPLQDWLSTDGKLRAPNPADERINIPSDPDHHWKYRMHLTIERLLNEDTFNNKIKQFTSL